MVDELLQKATLSSIEPKIGIVFLLQTPKRFLIQLNNLYNIAQSYIAARKKGYNAKYTLQFIDWAQILRLQIFFALWLCWNEIKIRSNFSQLVFFWSKCTDAKSSLIFVICFSSALCLLKSWAIWLLKDKSAVKYISHLVDTQSFCHNKVLYCAELSIRYSFEPVEGYNYCTWHHKLRIWIRTVVFC